MGKRDGIIEDDEFSAAERGFARLLLEILFDKFFPAGKREIEHITEQWENVKPLRVSYINRIDVDLAQLLPGVVKSLTAFSGEWAVNSPSRDSIEASMGGLGGDAVIMDKVKSVVSGYYKVRTDLMGKVVIGEKEALIGENREWLKTLSFARKIAKTDIPVMILGETGTGKDRLAEFVHQNSARREAGYTAINCGALPESLIISELFGYVDGAFTGAQKGGSRGRLAAASGGTLLLDDVDTLPLAAQAALLRFIETGEIQKVGSVDFPRSEVRIICTSNKDLLKLSYEQKFRLDLYYRLSIFKLEAPPLRKRPDDIPLLALHFLKRLDAMGRNGGLVTISVKALDKLQTHHWPGNLRELQSVLWRAALESENGVIQAGHIRFEKAAEKDIKDETGLPSHLLSDLMKRLAGLKLPPEEREKAAEFITSLNGGWFSNRDWAGKFAVSAATARNRLEMLVKGGILVKEGSKKGTRYKVK